MLLGMETQAAHQETTMQDRMAALLSKLGLPYKEIKIYGGQIVVTCIGWPTAKRWNSVLWKFAKVQRVMRSFDLAKKNKFTVNRPTQVKVWRVYATLDR